MERERAPRALPCRWRLGRARLPIALARLGALGVLLGLVPLGAHAATEDTRLWTTFEVSGPLVGSVRAGLLVQPRFRDDLGELDRVLVQPSLSFPIAEPLVGGLGYDLHRIDNPQDATEHRIWEQLALQTAVLTASVHHRIRLEQRFLEDVSGVAVRLRYRLRASHPLADSRVAAVLSNEVFFDLNTLRGGPRAGFGESRTFVGLRAPLRERLAIEGGYQLQYVDRKPRDEMNHVLMLGFSLAVP